MIVEPTENYELITTILKSMWDRCAEDGTIADDYQEGPEPKSMWLIARDDDNVMGVIFLHQDSSSIARMHLYIIKEFRPRVMDIMKMFFVWFDTLPKQIIKLSASIPLCHENVYNAAKRVGFIDEGINRQSYRKHGEVWDQWNIGLTREEIRGLCNE